MPRPAVAKAAVRPRNSRNAGAKRSKTRSKFARDMTHTPFQLEILAPLFWKLWGAGAFSFEQRSDRGVVMRLQGIYAALRYEIMVTL